MLADDKISRLTLINREVRNRVIWWWCRCECGNTLWVRYNSLSRILSGKKQVISCGCYTRERVRQLKLKHGQHNTPMYRTWRNMIRRCYNLKHLHYKNYGGRGITVCDRWRYSFVNFLADMGERPPGLILDRINNDGNYEPGNCRWTTRQISNQNRRKFHGHSC